MAQKSKPKEESSQARQLLNLGGKEIASLQGVRLFSYAGNIYNDKLTTMDDHQQHVNRILNNSSITLEGILNPHFDIVYDEIRREYFIKPKDSKEDVMPKNIEILVILDAETKEILKGKEELEKHNLLGVRKLNNKEECIVNIEELVDYYTMEEINRGYMKFDLEKNADIYKTIYNKHLNNLMRFKAEN